MNGILLGGLAATLVTLQDMPAAEQVIFQNLQRDVRVRYEFTAAGVEFSAHLPAGWAFAVAVDGDQDGRWGDGPDVGRTASHPTPDHNFGQRPDGSFCPQYILSARPQDPGRIYANSLCGGYPSQGSTQTTEPDAQMRSTITLRIPSQELFGDRPDAHLQLCIWDTRRLACHYTPTAPFILHRPATPAGP